MKRDSDAVQHRTFWHEAWEKLDDLAGRAPIRIEERPPRDLWSYLQIGTGVVAAVCLIGSFTLTHVYSAIASHLPSGGDYVASPHFSLDEFDSLRIGMNEGELRNTLGFPLQREYSHAGNCFWVYTLAQDGSDEYLRCTAVVDESGNLVATHKAGLQRCPYGTAWWTPYLEAKPREIWLTDAAGVEHPLSDFGDPLVLVAGGSTDTKEEALADVKSRLAEVGLEDMRVLYLAQPQIDDEGAVREVEPDVFHGSRPMLSDPHGRMIYIVSQGVLEAMPPHAGSYQLEERRKDETWLFRKVQRDRAMSDL